jgi:uncharacterized membrane protein
LSYAGGVVVGGSKTSLLKIVAIVISIAFSVVLFFIAYCFHRRRARKKCNTLSEENGEEKFFDHEILSNSI